MRVTVSMGADMYGAVVAGGRELQLPESTPPLEVGDIVHLVEVGAQGETGRCCARLVTRKRGAQLVTVLGGTGQCEGWHG